MQEAATNLKVFIIGPTAAGKSTVGAMVAAALQWQFNDIDSLIAIQQSKSIATIFSDDGEPAFRALESAILKQVALTTNNAIIATGGGIIINSQNINIMRHNSIIIYLQASITTQLTRIAQDESNIRPLLHGQEAVLTLKTMARQRNSIYEQAADHIINTDDLSAQEVAQLMQQFMQIA